MEATNPAVALLFCALLVSFAVLGFWTALQWVLKFHFCRTEHGLLIHKEYCWHHGKQY